MQLSSGNITKDVEIANKANSTTAEPINPIDLSLIDNMDAEALKQLIRRVSGAMWGVGLKTREQREEALLLKLITFALTRDDAKEVVALAKEYFDRARGKPPQSVDINAKIGIVAIVLEAAKRGCNSGLISDSKSNGASNAVLVDNGNVPKVAIQRIEPS